MFGRKPKDVFKPKDPPVDVISMPADFYGGANPIIKFKDVTKIVVRDQNAVTPAEKKILDKKTKAGGESKNHPVNFLSNRKNLFLIALGVFLLSILGVSLYYFLQYKIVKKDNIITPIVNTSIPSDATSSESSAIAIETTSTPALETAPSAPVAINLQLPSQFLYDGQDMDKDQVSDVAEDVFGTDPGNPDTDKDGYPDGHEISYLYDPNGYAPKKLIDSNLIRDYENQVFFYKIYYPKDWALGEVDTFKRDILFSNISGESIELSAFDLALGETFSDWFAKNLPQEKFSDLSTFESVFKVNGLMRKDGLVYYFFDQNRIYVLFYRTADSATVNYRAVLTMMARSFRLQNSTGDVPSQITNDQMIFSASSTTSTL